MFESTSLKDFDIQEASAHRLKCTYAGLVEPWKSLKIKTNPFDIQQTEDRFLTRSSQGYAGEIDDWVRIRTARDRRLVTYSVLALIVIWVLLGLYIYVITKNFWLLLASESPVLTPLNPLIRGVASYYYCLRPKRSKKRKKH